MTLEQTVERYNGRLAAVKSGKAKLQRLLTADPNSPKAAAWRNRIAEYEFSLGGLPGVLAAAAIKLAKRKSVAAEKKR